MAGFYSPQVKTVQHANNLLHCLVLNELGNNLDTLRKAGCCSRPGSGGRNRLAAATRLLRTAALH
jgi:hypothetical protein